MDQSCLSFETYSRWRPVCRTRQCVSVLREGGGTTDCFVCIYTVCCPCLLKLDVQIGTKCHYLCDHTLCINISFVHKSKQQLKCIEALYNIVSTLFSFHRRYKKLGIWKPPTVQVSLQCCVTMHYRVLGSVLVIVIMCLQTVPLQSIMHELDECFMLCKGTVWRGITHGRTYIYRRDMSNIPMCYLISYII